MEESLGGSSSLALDSKRDLIKRKEEEKTSQDANNNRFLLKDSSDEEITKIRLMRSFVETKDPSSKEVDDLCLRRFLRARDLDVEKGSAMILKYLKWRRSYVPNGLISASEVSDQLANGITFSQGFDKMGRPIAVTFAARYFKGKDGAEGFKRFAVFSLDKLCSRMPARQEKFCIISDFKGWGFSNMDLKGSLGALTIVQEYFPERLGKLFQVNAPSIFSQAWKIISPFVDNNTKKKFVFVDNKKIKSTLLEDIDESQLPEIYGGKLPLVPIQDCA